jgi:DNA-directed RNA polymerase II subunit RPB2
MAHHVFDSYFRDTANPLVRHHLDSYADLLKTKIPKFIHGTNPRHLILEDGRIIDIYVGGKNADKILYLPPVDETGNAFLPHMCRLENKTYSLEIRADIDIEYTFEKEVVLRTFPNILIGKIPLMLKSSLCHLSTMDSDKLYQAGECKFELGGYFIIGGAEKVLLTQERLGENMFYASKRPVVSGGGPSGKSLVEKEKASKLEGATKEDKYEFIAGIRSVSEDGTKGPYSHFLIIPPANVKPDETNVSDYAQYSTKRLATITLPGFTQPVPLLSVFYALGFTNDQDIYDTVLHDIPQIERSKYDEIFMELILSHDEFVRQEMLKEDDKEQDPNLLFLRRQTRTRSTEGVYINLFSDLFPHCEPHDAESPSAFYHRKGFLLGHMMRMAIDVALNLKQKTDRDHLRYKRFVASGELCFQEFRRIYKDVASRMLTELDSRVHYEQQAYAGKKLLDLVQDENISYYWRYNTFLNDIEKSFKGKWAKKYDGVAQELTRFAFVGTLAQLRRVNVDMDKGTKIVESRRIHASSWGLMCPADNPDGGGIGLTKSLTLLCSISTASPSSDVLKILQEFKHFIPLSTIHPSMWDPRWTKVFINSDFVGAVDGNTDKMYRDLLSKRRSGQLNRFVSLSWSPLDNELLIFTDAGRPARPIYQEGVREDQILNAKKWTDILQKYMDLVDAQESETLRIQMEPFSPKHPSEIHGLAILSANSSILPNSDFNPATRNAFSCQQMKQACSWYNSAFNKRFDTIATWLNYAQRPLSQTWTYEPIMGCLPYGENPIVALMIYSGYNQEDSVLLNEGSLQRGLFSTTYYHSYDSSERMIDIAARTHTEFGNPKTNPKYKDSVVLNPKYNYDLLDADGIIKTGVKITETTVLVGIVSPVSVDGQVTGFRDGSTTPKRGQHGIVDAVYRYVTSEGLLGVKIRVAEPRIPVLGDKFSARHGQKGTVGMRVPEEDMPYTKDGLRPDMIVNPHAFPSRMTIGQFVETMSTKAAVQIGAIADATPFSTQNRVGEMKEILLKLGYHPYAHENLYNGQSGEMIGAEIFIGPTYYLRSKLMVEDKINFRATGPKKLLTHQPAEGRANEGGLRIGEMERDCLLSHGASKFLNESLMERSDKTELLFDPDQGILDARADTEGTILTTPYSLGLVIHELEAMHITTKLIS